MLVAKSVNKTREDEAAAHEMLSGFLKEPSAAESAKDRLETAQVLV